jgi:hypothetical protein
VTVFASGSRYAGLEIATVRLRQPDGSDRDIRYARRRLLPPVDQHTTLLEHTVAAGERLDLLAARYLGDPTQFWRLCDATGAVRPEELEVIGAVVVVAMPGKRS